MEFLNFPRQGRIRPLYIGRGIGEEGFRLGGSPPVGIVTRKVDLKYYLTVPMLAALEASFFFADDPEVIFDNARKLHGIGSEVVDVVFHEPRFRGSDSTQAYDCRPHEVIVGAEMDDKFCLFDSSCGDNDIVFGLSKIGGDPINSFTSYKFLNNLMKEGYIMYLQLNPGQTH